MLKEIPEDDELRRHWNVLVERCDRPQVFYTYEWALAVQRAYHATLSPLIILAYDDGNILCGLVALAVDGGRQQATFLCATTGDYCDFLSAPEKRNEFVGLVLGELDRQKIRGMALANLPADSPTLEALRHAASEHGSHCFARTAYVCAQVVFERLERNKDGKPYAPGLKRLKRFTKAMGAAEPVRTEHLRSWEVVGPALPGFEKAHVARFLEIGRISNVADATRRIFLAELVKLLPEQWLVLSRMWAGDRVVAWHYGFQFHGSWFWYQPTFDSSVEKHWPGFCLLSQVIEDAIAMPGMTMLDLGLGSEAYKAKIANESRETLYVTLHQSILAHWGTMIRYRMVEAVKASPTMEKIAEGARKKIRGLRARLKEKGVGGSVVWLIRRLFRSVWARDEVFFYELTNPGPAPLREDDLILKTIDLKTLATAAMQNQGDQGTMDYVLRCAHRLRTENDSTGYALTNPAGELLHFTWSGPFAGFHWSELDSKLPSPAAESVVMFDSWTPVSQRGRGYYAPTLGRAVARIRQEGKRSWGFSASTNASSVRGLEKAGFQRCFSVFRYRLLWWQKVVRKDAAVPCSPDT